MSTTTVPQARERAPLPTQGRRIPEQYWGYVLLAPAVLLVLGLILYPVAYSFWLSFHSKHAFLPIETFIGFENYIELFTNSEDFWRSIELGAIYAFGSVGLQLIVGVSAALLLNQTFVGRTFIRGVTLFPYMVPTVVVVILFRWLFNDAYGFFPYALDLLGLDRDAFLWMEPEHVMLTVILISTWTFFPFVVIGTLARLQTIDPELYAAAKVDGAGVFRRFIHVTLPQISSVLFVIVLLRFIFMFTKFDVIWLLTGASGLGYFVRTLPIYTFVVTFNQLQVGAGAALSVIMFMLLAGFAYVYFKLFRREENL
ncbi:MAG: sugar ABC transporter permease [Minwuiales bacterium]|nr:sugar ABC transporter permease [Minwuiales bacterium]